jgi:hypothetical protein
MLGRSHPSDVGHTGSLPRIVGPVPILEVSALERQGAVIGFSFETDVRKECLTALIKGSFYVVADYPSHHVWRSRNPALARFAREHAEAVRSFDWTWLNIPAGDPSRVRSGAVCASDCYHAFGVSFRCR